MCRHDKELEVLTGAEEYGNRNRKVGSFLDSWEEAEMLV